MKTCRFCKKQSATLLKYGPRHYAHARCGLDAQGEAFLDHFTDWQLSRFPYLIAKEYGLRRRIEDAYRRQNENAAAPPGRRRTS